MKRKTNLKSDGENWKNLMILKGFEHNPQVKFKMISGTTLLLIRKSSSTWQYVDSCLG